MSFTEIFERKITSAGFRALFALGMLGPIEANAHVPLVLELGGIPTQNVVAGPIKHRPVNNAPTRGPEIYQSTVELTYQTSARPSLPPLHVNAVFLGTEWLDLRYRGDKVSGLDQFYRAYWGSTYAAAIGEYAGSDNVGGFSDYQYEGHVIDGRPVLGPVPAARVQFLICNMVQKGSLKLSEDQTNYVAVYSTHKRPSGASCGSHGWFLCESQHVYFSFSYDLDQDPQCEVPDSVPEHSSGLAALANESARALADVRTDFDFFSWYDKYGNEVDDKCAWTFSVPYVTFADGSKWKLQDLWSNKAYEAGTGAPNVWGQKGCVTGK